MQNTGSLFGTVVDNQGQALPGVTVKLTGHGAPQVQVTDAQGRFRFPNLSPGTYNVEAQLEGFSTYENPNVVVNSGRDTDMPITLELAVSL
jgi:Carboxypeptidase regulatory-like domain